MIQIHVFVATLFWLCYEGPVCSRLASQSYRKARMQERWAALKDEIGHIEQLKEVARINAEKRKPVVGSSRGNLTGNTGCILLALISQIWNIYYSVASYNNYSWKWYIILVKTQMLKQSVFLLDLEITRIYM